MHINARTLWTTLAAVLVAAAAVITASVHAQEGNGSGREHAAQGGFGPGRAMGPIPGLRQLNLTDQQREQIRAILQEARASNEAEGRNAGALQHELRAAIFADSPDLGKIGQLKTAIATAQASALDARIALDLKIAEVLTPEQRAKARDLPARGPGRSPGRGPRR